MSWTKNDKAFKILVNKRGTSSSKASYEEVGDRTLNVHVDEVWMRGVPGIPSQAVSEGVAEQRTLFTLTEDITVANHQCYYAYESGNSLKDWISDKYGTGYAVHLYQNTGTEIFPTDSSDWFFDYTTGILTLNSTAGLSLPLKISGYRYIGTKGVTGIQGITGMGGGSGGATGLQGVTGAGLQGETGVAFGVTGIISMYVNGGGSSVSTGIKSEIRLSFDMYLKSWEVLLGDTGSVLIGLWKGDYDNYPPIASNALHVGATGPYVVNGLKNRGDTDSWGSPTGAVGDIIRVNVDSVTGASSILLSLGYYRT